MICTTRLVSGSYVHALRRGAYRSASGTASLLRTRDKIGFSPWAWSFLLPLTAKAVKGRQAILTGRSHLRKGRQAESTSESRFRKCRQATAQLADPIYRRFTGEFLPTRRDQGQTTMDRDVVARWMDALFRNHRSRVFGVTTVPSW
jgi:hypothetical protein